MKNVMYVCMDVKLDIFSRNDMRWNMDHEYLEGKETCKSVIFPMHGLRL